MDGIEILAHHPEDAEAAEVLTKIVNWQNEMHEKLWLMTVDRDYLLAENERLTGALEQIAHDGMPEQWESNTAQAALDFVADKPE